MKSLIEFVRWIAGKTLPNVLGLSWLAAILLSILGGIALLILPGRNDRWPYSLLLFIVGFTLWASVIGGARQRYRTGSLFYVGVVLVSLVLATHNVSISSAYWHPNVVLISGLTLVEFGFLVEFGLPTKIKRQPAGRSFLDDLDEGWLRPPPRMQDKQEVVWALYYPRQSANITGLSLIAGSIGAAILLWKEEGFRYAVGFLVLGLFMVLGAWFRKEWILYWEESPAARDGYAAKLHQRVNDITEALSSATQLLNELQREIEQRRNLAKKLQAEVEASEQLKGLNQEAVEATAGRLREELRRAGRKSVVLQVILTVVGIVAGLLISLALYYKFD